MFDFIRLSTYDSSDYLLSVYASRTPQIVYNINKGMHDENGTIIL